MKAISTIGKAACIAFSMFSKIPVPQFEWEEQDMKYMILFFPLVGIVIGAAAVLWGLACSRLSIGSMCAALIGTAIPALISGGIHIDGYMDTMDALHSYQPREKKLEILKDPHIGAFAAIGLGLYFLLYAGAYAELKGYTALLLLGAGYWLSRILSAIAVIRFPCAKEDGLLHQFSSSTDRRRGSMFLYLQLAVCAFLMVAASWRTGAVMLLASLVTLMYYRKKCLKEFGGTTGDTSGFFTTVCEAVLIVVIAAGCMAGWI